MKAMHCIFIISISFSLLIGCKSPQGQPLQTGGIKITSENFDRICGMQWILQRMIIDDEEYQLAAERPFIKFTKAGKVSGYASINRYFGTIEFDSHGKLQWSKAFGSTRMAGPEELMNQERAFLTALPSTEQLSMEGIHLYASTEDGRTEFVFYVPVN